MLVVVGSPIGNDGDWSERALRVLAEADVVAAEDTRVARKRLSRVGVQPRRLVSYHDHNETQRVGSLVGALERGEIVALLSDAGMPLVSDPGYRLVAAAVEAQVPIDVVPGPSAVLAALATSGLPPDRFLFTGFPPRQAGKRVAWLSRLAEESATLILFEAPHRILATLKDAEGCLGERRACLAISLSKPWQRFHRGTLSKIRESLEADPEEVKGEMSLVVSGAEHSTEMLDARAEEVVLRLAAAGVAPGTIRDAVAPAFEVSRRQVYQRALEAITRASEGA